jgi:hypothetical protein
VYSRRDQKVKKTKPNPVDQTLNKRKQFTINKNHKKVKTCEISESVKRNKVLSS